MIGKLRPLIPDDGVWAAQVFFDAVHVGAADAYTEKERWAWAGSEPDPEGWRRRFDHAEGFAAEADGKPVGFMTLEAYRYIDLAYVAPDVMGHGIGRQLYEAIERRALEGRADQLTTEASKKARPFFERMGWQVDGQQTVVRRDTPLINFKMSKTLAGA